MAEAADLLHLVNLIAHDFNTTLEIHLAEILQQLVSVGLCLGW